MRKGTYGLCGGCVRGKNCKSKSGQLLDMVGLLWRLDFPPWGILFRRKLVRKQTSLLCQSNLQSEGGILWTGGIQGRASKRLVSLSCNFLQHRPQQASLFCTKTSHGIIFFRGYLSKRFSTVSPEMDQTLTVFRANRKFRQSRSEKFRSAPRPWRWAGWTASGTATTPTATSTSTPFSPFPWRRSSSRLTSTTSVSSLHRFLSNNKKTFNARARNSVSAVSAVWRKKSLGPAEKKRRKDEKMKSNFDFLGCFRATSDVELEWARLRLGLEGL